MKQNVLWLGSLLCPALALLMYLFFGPQVPLYACSAGECMYSFMCYVPGACVQAGCPSGYCQVCENGVWLYCRGIGE